MSASQILLASTFMASLIAKSRGEQGDKGEQGGQGEQGDNGDDGANINGADGADGAVGNTGPAGSGATLDDIIAILTGSAGAALDPLPR